MFATSCIKRRQQRGPSSRYLAHPTAHGGESSKRLLTERLCNATIRDALHISSCQRIPLSPRPCWRDITLLVYQKQFVPPPSQHLHILSIEASRTFLRAILTKVLVRQVTRNDGKLPLLVRIDGLAIDFSSTTPNILMCRPTPKYMAPIACPALSQSSGYDMMYFPSQPSQPLYGNV